MLEADAYPYIGNRPTLCYRSRRACIDGRRVEERGSPSVAIKLRQYVSNVFQYAVIRRGVTSTIGSNFSRLNFFAVFSLGNVTIIGHGSTSIRLPM